MESVESSTTTAPSLYFGKSYLPKYNKTHSLDNLNVFLENEKQTNLQDNWSKLNKSVKKQKVLEFSETYAEENNLSEEEKKLLQTFLKDSLDKKKLSRVKDVHYDRQTGKLISIIGLTYLKPVKRFTLKVSDVGLDSTRKQCVQIV